jgi:hypothetical protein
VKERVVVINKKPKTIMRIALKGPDREALGKLAREFRLDTGGAGGARTQPDGTVRMEAYVPEEVLAKLEKAGATFEVIEDATKVGKERQKEVGRGDRYEGGKVVPRGLGKKE